MMYSALILGILSSVHCVGMCGPIAFILPIDKSNVKKSTHLTLLYHLGRITTYASLGLVFGLIGKGLFMAGFQQRLSILLGVVMIVIALLPSNFFAKYSGTNFLFKGIAKLKQQLGLQLKQRKASSIYTVGVLNGLLPCGMVYMALFGAIATGALGSGMVYMTVFGLGTVPLMSLAIYSKTLFSQTLRNKLQRVLPFFIVTLGILFILRGLDLGIPYISPTTIQLQISNSVEVCK
ncbi:sulfite exporter TauE/SafE family protein [Flavobacteriaceae bacterium F08102]|nr:sulfite exporter TauE/SafE family protein [Flavobacteriaceae bacterium F08102]